MIASAIAAILLAVILVRCAVVVNGLRFADRGGRSWIAWESFGLSYCLLVLAAAGSTWQIMHKCQTIGDWLWLIASAGLIAFDRRKKGSA